MTLLLLFVGPVGMGLYLQGFSSISEERLATLALSSPYSAAFSIPMPPAPGQRAPGDGTGDQESHTRLPVPMLGLKLPVWALFLLIYPPFCVVLYFVTYLTFRWRWWRAGGSG
jgi:hypothetical protein